MNNSCFSIQSINLYMPYSSLCLIVLYHSLSPCRACKAMRLDPQLLSPVSIYHDNILRTIPRMSRRCGNRSDYSNSSRTPTRFLIQRDVPFGLRITGATHVKPSPNALHPLHPAPIRDVASSIFRRCQRICWQYVLSTRDDQPMPLRSVLPLNE